MNRYNCRRVFCTAAFFAFFAFCGLACLLLGEPVPAAADGVSGTLAVQLYAAWLEGVETVLLDPPLPISVLEKNYFALRDTCPELFWVDCRFGYAADAGSGLVQSVSPGYLCRTDEVDELSALYTSKINALTDTVSGETGDFRIARLLHDALAASVTYGQPSASALGDAGQFTAYGALVEGRAVCRGYAMAYLHVLRRCGIDAVYVHSKTMNHGWVMACLDGIWVHIDVTRDDGDAVSHRYFARSDAAMYWMGYTDWLIGRE